jgi:peptide-methionine (S)-S-oxide reductase
MVRGVSSSVAGYAGGDTEDPTYDQVITGTTHHAETVRITYDEDQITLEQILTVFWTIHDPTTPNRQGNDVGTQYRSCIFYENEADRPIIDDSIIEAQKHWSDPIVTEVAKLTTFYPAEDYHQNYFAKNPDAGYCQVVINPKLAKLREKAAELLA